MKKLLKTVTIILFAEIIIISCLILYLMYDKSDDDINYGVYQEKKNDVEAEVDRTYNIEAEVNVKGKSIQITEEIFFDASKDKLGLYIPSANTAETRIKQVVSDGGVVRISRQDIFMEVKLKNKCDSIRINYEILPGSTKGTLLYTEGAYYLTNFLITPMVYRNEKPVYTIKKDFGDPYIYEMNNYRITFKTESGLDVYAPGGKKEQVAGKYKTTTFEALNIRDFPAVLLSNADVRSEKYGDTNLHFINSEETGRYVKEAFRFATENIGDYPYSDFYVVRAPISINGMEFSNMIFLSDRCFDSSSKLKRVTYHEVFHQWFYGIIGTDQLNEPFFDEGLVDYLAENFSNEQTRQWKNKNLNKPLQDYTSKNEYYELAYYDSAAYFHTIHQKLGNNFYKMLNEVYSEWKYKIIYFDDFQKYVNKY